MRSTITTGGQTVIPAGIRHQFQLGAADCLEWLVEDGRICVVPVIKDPVDAFRGSGPGGATARLAAARQQDDQSK